MKMRPQRQTAGDEALMEVPDANPLPDELAVRAESAHQAIVARRALARALEALEPQDRRLITLRFQTGLTVADIARASGIDQKQLYRRLGRLLTALRLALEADASVGDVARRLAEGGPIELGEAASERDASRVA
jgi:RNA polymerase sigma factor (sigma-70 family)